MHVKDQLGRIIKVDTPPKRIISLVPSLTELLCDLGLESRLIGVTKFCVHPSQIRKDKEVIGGTKQIKLSKIKDLNPDIIIANKEENTKKIIEDLESFVPVHISDVNNVQDAIDLIGLYGILFEIEDIARSLITSIQLKLEALKPVFNSLSKPTIAYFIWKDPWMVVGSETFINSMITLCGFKNYFEESPRYPEIELASIDSKKLDFILLSSEPYPFSEKHIEELQLFCPNTPIKIVDGEMFSWYGSRMIKAFDYFKQVKNTL